MKNTAEMFFYVFKRQPGINEIIDWFEKNAPVVQWMSDSRKLDILLKYKKHLDCPLEGFRVIPSTKEGRPLYNPKDIESGIDHESAHIQFSKAKTNLWYQGFKLMTENNLNYIIDNNLHTHSLSYYFYISQVSRMVGEPIVLKFWEDFVTTLIEE